MSSMRWDPFGEMTSLRQAMDRLLEDSLVRSGGSRGVGDSTTGMVPLDVMERDDAIVVKASLPGVRPDDVDVSVHRNVLTIQGEMRGEQEKGEGHYRHRERWSGRFSRQIAVPSGVDSEACDATFQDGVLTITLPKSEQSRAKRINIRGGGSRAIEGERSDGNADGEVSRREQQPAARGD